MRTMDWTRLKLLTVWMVFYPVLTGIDEDEGSGDEGTGWILWIVFLVGILFLIGAIAQWCDKRFIVTIEAALNAGNQVSRADYERYAMLKVRFEESPLPPPLPDQGALRARTDLRP